MKDGCSVGVSRVAGINVPFLNATEYSLCKLGKGRRGMNTCKVFLSLCNLSGIKKNNGKLTLLGNPHPAKQITVYLTFSVT